MRVVTLCGSHHSGSTNAVVLTTIARRLADAGVEVEPLRVDDDVPSFRPESIDRPPDAVLALRDAFGAADGAVFAVPEYAGGLPGWVKNITDWMVGVAAFYERPVVVASAATAGGANAIEQLARTLTWQGAYVVATASIAAPLTIVRDDELTDADAIARLHAAADVLVAVLSGRITAAQAAAGALAPIGLDLADRPD